MLDFDDDFHLAAMKFVRLIFSCSTLLQGGKILECRFLANKLFSLFSIDILLQIFLVLLHQLMRILGNRTFDIQIFLFGP